MTDDPTDRADIRARVEKALAIFLIEQRQRLANIDPDLVPLADALDSLILGGGKRLRPAFAYWGYRGAGGYDSDEVVATLAALELVQASALIHDDVMDSSDTRRGLPAMHRRFADMHTGQRWHGDADMFGAGTAILLGDFCLIWSDELLQNGGLDPLTVARARPEFEAMRTEVTAGQYLDVLTQATGNSSLERASKVARYKAAKYTVERPLRIGATLAGAPAPLAEAYSAYGLPLGVAFQLRDDILGVFGDPGLTGKPAGDDLREGKRTYLIAAALDTAASKDRETLLRGLGDPALDPAGVEILRDIIVRTGGLARTEAHIDELCTSALTALSTVDIEAEAAEVLAELAAAATRRTG